MVDESECKYVASDGWVATDEMVSYGCSKTGWSGRVIYEIAKVHKCCTAWASCSLNDEKKKKKKKTPATSCLPISIFRRSFFVSRKRIYGR